MTTTDDRPWLAEAREYQRGERRSLPSIEHVTAALALADSFKQSCIERDAVITMLIDEVVELSLGRKRMARVG